MAVSSKQTWERYNKNAKCEITIFHASHDTRLGHPTMQPKLSTCPAPLTIAAQRSRGRRRYTRLSLVSARRGAALTTKSKSPVFPSCHVDVEAEARMRPEKSQQYAATQRIAFKNGNVPRRPR